MEQYHQDIDMNSTKLEAMSINDDDHHHHPPLSLSDYLDIQMNNPNIPNFEYVNSMDDDSIDINQDEVKDDDDDGDDNHLLLLPDYVPQQMKEVAMGGIMKEEPLSVSTMKANIKNSNLEPDKKESYLDKLFFLDPDYWWEIKAGYKDFPLLKFPYCPLASFHGVLEEIQKFNGFPGLKNFKLELQRVQFPLPPQRIQLKFAVIDI